VVFAGYQVNESLMSLARPEALFMHCLPAHRGEEVVDEVIDGPQSVVVEQAENRLHLQKALMATLVKKNLEVRASTNGVLALGAVVAAPGA
jgi:ornithine carbamoyltransferase